MFREAKFIAGQQVEQTTWSSAFLVGMDDENVVATCLKSSLPARTIGCERVVWPPVYKTERTDADGQVLEGLRAGVIGPHRVGERAKYEANEEQAARLGPQAAARLTQLNEPAGNEAVVGEWSWVNEGQDG